MGLRFISTDTVSKIGKGFKPDKTKKDERLTKEFSSISTITESVSEDTMSKNKYLLTKIVDCLRVYAVAATPLKNNNLEARITMFLNNLKGLGDRILLDEESLLHLVNVIGCNKRGLVTEIMLICESRARYKTLSLSDINNFIRKQHEEGLLIECMSCRKPYAVITKDHIFPKSKGGIDHPFNIQNMCVFCNSIKSNKLEDIPSIDVYYHSGSKILLPVDRAKALGITLTKSVCKGKVYVNNPHILNLPKIS